MVEQFLKIRKWTPKIFSDLFSYLDHLDSNEKCKVIFRITERLVESNSCDDNKTAEELLIFASENYLASANGDAKALIFYRLGQLYEKCFEDYSTAFEYYKMYASHNTEFDNVNSLLLRAILLRDDFIYSEEMENYLKLSYGEINLGLRNDRIYEHIGSLLVARKNGDEKMCEIYTKRIKAIVKAEDAIIFDLLMRKDTVRDTLMVPKKVFDFIDALQ